MEAAHEAHRIVTPSRPLTPSQPFRELSHDQNHKRLLVRNVFSGDLRVRVPGHRDQSARRLRVRRNVPVRAGLHLPGLVTLVAFGFTSA